MVFNGTGGLVIAKWDTEKNEIVIARKTPDTKLEYNAQIAFHVSFGKVEAVAGKPVIGFLNAAAGEVERIVMALEAESRRIGLIS